MSAQFVRVSKSIQLSCRAGSVSACYVLMEMYNYSHKLHTVWSHAIELYQEGKRDSAAYFDDEQMSFLHSIGHTAQEVFDFAEDFVKSGEPDFTTFALCAEARRVYFN